MTNLAKMMPDLWWFRDSGFETSRGTYQFQTTVILSERVKPSSLAAYVNDRPVEISEPTVSMQAENWFKFVPALQRLGYIIEVADRSLGDVFSLTITNKGILPQNTAWQFRDWQSIVPLPPKGNIERTNGAGSTAFFYHNNGLTEFKRFAGVAKKHGVDIEAPGASVLDWGSGAGRLTRHFLKACPQTIGIDIDRDNVAWCNANLKNGAFYHVDLYPPTPFPDSSFDLIIANSVLSHLKLDAMRQWLKEVRRLLKPNGLALLSYHGDFSTAIIAADRPTLLNSVLSTGFNADLMAPILSDHIADPEYYRNTFMTDRFAESVFEEYFKVREVIPGMVSRFQNVAVLA